MTKIDHILIYTRLNYEPDSFGNLAREALICNYLNCAGLTALYILQQFRYIVSLLRFSLKQRILCYQECREKRARTGSKTCYITFQSQQIFPDKRNATNVNSASVNWLINCHFLLGWIKENKLKKTTF